MPGHLFVARGDIRRIVCDAWLLPTATNLEIEAIWTRGDKRLDAALRAGAAHAARSACPGWDARTQRATPMLLAAQGLPAVWLGNVGGHAGTPIEEILAAVPEFLRSAAAAVPRPEADRRDRPLLAIPFVGTGKGGKAHRKGQVARELVRLVSPVLAEVDADVVLVTHNEEAHAAAQRARRLYAGGNWRDLWRRAFDDASAFMPLGDPFELGRELAGHARRSRLVLFAGAGVSAGAGLPQWSTLVDRLAEHVDVRLDGLDGLSLVDKATVIETALARANKSIGEAVVEQIPDGPYALAHSLMAAMPCTEVITTNYDRRLETAAEDLGRPFTVLHDRSVAGADRWLLKLHGSTDNPADIVLTRDDYLGYGQRRAALRGVVQAMLMTRHMLFVGFGLSDDNFHAIAHDVRTALRSGSSTPTDSPFGTALLVHERTLFNELWKGDITPAALAPLEAPIGIGARRVELLLDLIVAESTGALAHFMDPTFEDLLREDERMLRRELEGLWSKRRKDSPAWEALGDLVQSLGLRSGEASVLQGTPSRRVKDVRRAREP